MAASVETVLRELPQGRFIYKQMVQSQWEAWQEEMKCTSLTKQLAYQAFKNLRNCPRKDAILWLQ